MSEEQTRPPEEHQGANDAAESVGTGGAETGNAGAESVESESAEAEAPPGKAASDAPAEGADEYGPENAASGEETAGEETEEQPAAGEAAGEGSQEPGPESGRPIELTEFDAVADADEVGGIDLLMDVDLDVKIELGRTEMAIEDILRLRKGSVVELDKLAGDPVDILVNERAVAKGEIVVVNDNFCVRITDVVDPEAGLRFEGVGDE